MQRAAKLGGTPTYCRPKLSRIPVVEMLGESPFSQQAHVSPQPPAKRSATRSSPKSKLGAAVPAEAVLGSCLSSPCELLGAVSAARTQPFSALGFFFGASSSETSGLSNLL